VLVAIASEAAENISNASSVRVWVALARHLQTPAVCEQQGEEGTPCHCKINMSAF